MRVVPATLDHLPGLRRCFTRLLAEGLASHPQAYPSYGPEDLDQFTLLCHHRLSQRDETFICVVAEDEAGDLLGFLGGELTTRAVGHPRVFGAAHWLYVRPEARGQGVGRALTAAGVTTLQLVGKTLGHDVTHVELGALPGDPQWAARGWQPYLSRFALPVEAVLQAALAERPPVGASATPPPPARPARPARTRRPRTATRRTRPVANGHDTTAEA